MLSMRHCRNYARVDSVVIIWFSNLSWVRQKLLQSCEQTADRRRAGVARELAHSTTLRAPFSANRAFHQKHHGDEREHHDGHQPEAIEISEGGCLLLAQILQHLPRPAPSREPDRPSGTGPAPSSPSRTVPVS